MPFNIMGGMASGASFERGLENAMAGKAHPVRTARKALGNAMGQVDVWHGSPHSFDRFSMDKIGTGEGRRLLGTDFILRTLLMLQSTMQRWATDFLRNLKATGLKQ
jgi:hypothetical protein